MLAGEGADLYLGSEHGLTEVDLDVAVYVSALAPEETVAADVDLNDEISRRSTGDSGLSLAPQANLAAVIDALGYFDREPGGLRGLAASRGP